MEYSNPNAKIMDIGNLDIKKIDRIVVREYDPNSVYARKTTKSHVGSVRSKSTVHSKSSGNSKSSPIPLTGNLAKTTASFQKRIETKDEVVEDPWHSERNEKLAALGKQADKIKFEHVHSKLYSSTQSMKLKTVKEKEVVLSSSPKAQISPTSRILQPTASFACRTENHQETKSDADTVNEYNESRTLKVVEADSRLLVTTEAIKHSKFKSKADIEAEEQARIELELEERANNEKFRVLRTSERLLLPTAATEHARYRGPNNDTSSPTMNYPDDQSEISNSTSVRRVKEASYALLRPTKAMINAQYKAPDITPKSPIVSSATVQISERLITTTAGLENARYKKPETDIDPREVGWKTHVSKKTPETNTAPEVDDTASIKAKKKKRVKETSDRLLVSNEHQLWRGPQETATAVDTKKLTKIKPISPTDHLLKPKLAPSIPESEELDTKSEKKKIAKPSDHLLTLTVALEHGRYIKPEDRVPVEDSDDDMPDTASQGPTLRVKETSERVLSLTAAYQNHRKPSPEAPKELPKAVSSSEHFLTPTISYKISTTISGKSKGRVAFQTDDGNADDSSTSEAKRSSIISSSAHFLAPTASYIHRIEGSDGVYIPTSPRRRNHVSELWMDAVSASSSISSIRSVSPSVASISTSRSSTMSELSSSVSVKNLVQKFSIRSIK